MLQCNVPTRIFEVFEQMTNYLEANHLIRGPRYKEQMNLVVHSILSDVDNTLLPNESLGLPTPRVTQAFREAGEKVPTGLATARQLQKFAYLARHLKLTGMSILSNGAQIFDGKTGQMVIERTLQIETAISITRELQANGVKHWIQDNGIDHRWSPHGQNTHKAKGTSKGLGMYSCRRDVLDPKKGYIHIADYVPYKPFIIVAHKVDPVLAEYIMEMIKGYKDERLTAFIAHEHKDENGLFYEVFIADKKANKLEALLEIQQMEKIPLEEFLAIGDGHNDKVLIENTGIGVAMGNAVEPVKQVAVFIAPDQEHDGAAIAIEDLVLATSF